MGNSDNAKAWRPHNENFRKWLEVEMSFMALDKKELARITGMRPQQVELFFLGKTSPDREFRFEIIQALARVIEGRDREKYNIPLVGYPESDRDIFESCLYDDYEDLGADYYFDERMEKKLDTEKARKDALVDKKKCNGLAPILHERGELDYGD